jgi:hypothetical protein
MPSNISWCLLIEKGRAERQVFLYMNGVHIYVHFDYQQPQPGVKEMLDAGSPFQRGPVRKLALTAR